MTKKQIRELLALELKVHSRWLERQELEQLRQLKASMKNLLETK